MRNGFSLVELSIVLVILGLLTGGILAGQSLIKAAELRSVGTDLVKLQTATYSFRDRYMAWPGDLNNATSFWGQNAAGEPCYTTLGTGTQTCNGNGDGRVYTFDISGNTYREYFQFFKHLTNAGLMEGNFTGITGPSGLNDQIAGVNMPRLRYPNASMSVGSSAGCSAATATTFAGCYGQNIGVGAPSTTGGTVEGLFRTEEVWNIDMKMDDGKPGLGKIITRKECADGTNEATANYLLSDTAVACRFSWVRLTN